MPDHSPGESIDRMHVDEIVTTLAANVDARELML